MRMAVAIGREIEVGNAIRLRGVRVHNLRDLDVDIPRDALVVLTGVSGSGKSSLAFDTIHAEGRRRYLEGLSSYARQFLDQMERPDVELDRRAASHGRDRPEKRFGEPEEHRRHRHRSLQLSPTPLCQDGRTALPEVRPGDPQASPRAGCRPGSRPRRRDQGARPRADGPGPEGPAPRRLPGDSRSSIDAGQGRRPGRRGRRGASQARQDQSPRHRSHRQPPGRPSRDSTSDRRERRPRLETGRRDGDPLGPVGRDLGGPDLQYPLRLPELRDEPGRDRASDVQLQQPPWRLSRLRWLGFASAVSIPTSSSPIGRNRSTKGRSPPGNPWQVRRGPRAWTTRIWTHS